MINNAFVLIAPLGVSGAPWSTTSQLIQLHIDLMATTEERQEELPKLRAQFSRTLSLSDDTLFLRMLWALNALQTGRAERARPYLQGYPPDARAAGIAGKNAIYPWELETLANELFTTPKDPIYTHLAPRTAHFRQTIEKGMRQLVVGASELFTSEEKLTALLGLDKNEPNEVFRSHISETLKSNEAIASLGLPDRVIERIAFYLAKEQFETTLGETMPAFRQLFHKWADEAETIARRGHNKALAKRDGPNARYDYLASLHWRIVAADKEGAILPDCVAIAVAYDGSTAPLMLADWDETAAVLMPISSESLLQGIRAGREVPPTFSFNSEAARASHRFFLAASNQPAISALQPLVDERASRLVDDAINHAFKDFLPKSEASSCAEPAEDEAAQESEAARVEEDWSYQLSFLGCADEGTAAEIGKAVSLLVDALGRSLPLKRLDGITFAADYPAALNVLDRGVLGPEPPSTIDPSIGTGIAQTVIIVRDGTVKCRIVLAGWIGHALIDMDEAQADWAIGVLSRQLSLVALTDILDTRLPGVLLQPIRDPLSGWLYGAVGAAIDGYMASHMSAGFGDPEELAAGFRELLTQALDRMREKVLAARLAYRHDADLDTCCPSPNQRSGTCCSSRRTCRDTVQLSILKRRLAAAN